MPIPISARLVALSALLALVCAACSAGTGSIGLSEPEVARVGVVFQAESKTAMTALEDIESFWASALAEVHGIEFEPVNGVIGYDTANDPLESIPTCETEMEDRVDAENAFYCPLDDSILFDEGVLFPEIEEAFGSFAVATVLAHEYGHAVQNRVGVFDEGAEPVAGVIVELQADCYAGAWVADVQQRGGGELGSSEDQVDAALGGLIYVSDPVGTGVAQPGAHGNAFDRVSAFSEGLFGGAAACVDYFENPPQVTARQFQNNELLTQGNLAVEEVVPLVVDGLELFWTTEFEDLFGVPYEVPEFVPMAPRTSPVPSCGGLEADPSQMEDLVTYCTLEGSVIADTERLLPTLATIGDFAVTYPVVHAWSQQVLLAGVGAIPDEGVIRAGDCVSGVWTRAIFSGQENLGLSAGDIDEAIISFGIYTPTGPDGTDPGEPAATIERVEAFRRGFFDGMDACLT